MEATSSSLRARISSPGLFITPFSSETRNPGTGDFLQPKEPPMKPTDSAQVPAATLLTTTGSGGRLWKDLQRSAAKGKSGSSENIEAKKEARAIRFLTPPGQPQLPGRGHPARPPPACRASLATSGPAAPSEYQMAIGTYEVS